MYLRLTIAFFLGFCMFCAATSGAHDAAFTELYEPALAKQTPVTLATFARKPTLVVFWRSDCTPCRVELGGILAAAKSHSSLQVALVALEKEDTARKALPSLLPANVHLLVAQEEPSATLRTYGDPDLPLPYSIFLHAGGKRCASHNGLLGSARIDQWIRAC